MSTESLARIAALTPSEHRDALCFLAGFWPDALTAALDEMDRQREALEAFNLRGGAAVTAAVVTEWFDAEHIKETAIQANYDRRHPTEHRACSGAQADECTICSGDESGPQIGTDYTLTSEALDFGQSRWHGTCLACGTETPWTTKARVTDMMTEHVAAEWMSH